MEEVEGPRMGPPAAMPPHPNPLRHRRRGSCSSRGLGVISGDVWCLGMYASGSTWLYNAVRLVAARSLLEQAVWSGYVAAAGDLPPCDPGVLHLMKSHDLDPATAALLDQRAGRILVSLRDPRDAVASLMRHMRHDFGAALARVERSARFCAVYASDPRATVLRYEDGFIDDPATLDRIARLIGGALAPETRASIFAATRRAAIEAFIAGLPSRPSTLRDAPSGDMLDPETQWHAHHAGRTGNVGVWRDLLDDARARRVLRRLGPCLAAWGYSAGRA